MRRGNSEGRSHIDDVPPDLGVNGTSVSFVEVHVDLKPIGLESGGFLDPWIVIERPFEECLQEVRWRGYGMEARFGAEPIGHPVSR